MNREDFSPLNTADLPQKLKDILKKREFLDAEILTVLEAGGGVLNVKEIMVGLYRMFGKIKTKNHVCSVVSRLKAAGAVQATGKRGEYVVTKHLDSK